MRSQLCLVLIVAGVVAAATPAEADIEIDLGSTLLLADTPDQMLDIMIAGDEPISGVDFYIHITGPDGATLPTFQITPQGVNGSVEGGVIAEGPGYVFNGALDFLDTVKSAANNANIALLTFDMEGVDPNGILLTLLVDTTGIHQGQFAVEPVIGFDVTDAIAESMSHTVHAGEIVIAPEPGMACTALSLIGLAAARPRRRRAI